MEASGAIRKEVRYMMRLLSSVLAFVKGIGVMRQSVRGVVDGFILRDFDGSHSIRLSEVVSVDGAKVDKVTYEENFLVLTMIDGRRIAIGELADGFLKFVAEITASLPDFPNAWSSCIEKAQTGDEIRLWPRPR